MSQRETTMLWLKDTIRHLAQCQQQLQWAESAETIQVLTESMLRDLEQCQRLCEDIHQRAHMRVAVS
jgi:hypothetical protein